MKGEEREERITVGVKVWSVVVLTSSASQTPVSVTPPQPLVLTDKLVQQHAKTLLGRLQGRMTHPLPWVGIFKETRDNGYVICNGVKSADKTSHQYPQRWGKDRGVFSSPL